MAKEKVPVTILTGFLGSGKTTLLNHILTAQHGKKIAVIENEFGEVGIDDALIKPKLKTDTEEDVIEMMNGCICCTVRQDLVEVLKKLAKRSEKGLKLDAIVIETTGLADPAPVAQTFFVDDDVKEFCTLDGIITLVDAKHVVQHLDDEKHFVLDVVVLQSHLCFVYMNAHTLADAVVSDLLFLDYLDSYSDDFELHEVF